MAFSWLINGGDPNHLLSGGPSSKYGELFHTKDVEADGDDAEGGSEKKTRVDHRMIRTVLVRPVVGIQENPQTKARTIPGV